MRWIVWFVHVNVSVATPNIRRTPNSSQVLFSSFYYFRVGRSAWYTRCREKPERSWVRE